MNKPFSLVLVILICVYFIYSCKVDPPIEASEPTGVDTTQTIVNPTIVSANFTIINDSCEAPCTVEFKNESLEATNYIWNFGDGTEEVSEESPEHEYKLGGKFEVSLIASAQGGVPDTAKKSIFITTKEDPVACLEITEISNNGFAPSTIRINNCSQNATQYNWTFGDGNESSQASQLAHTYLSSGTFEIKLVASDNLGNTDSITEQVIIKEVSTFLKFYSYEPNFADDEGWDLIQYENGDFLVAGRAQSNSLNDGLFLVQVDAEGNEIRSDQIQWHNGNRLKDGYSLFEARDGNIFIGGNEYFLKMNPNWDIEFSVENWFNYNKIIESSSGNIILAGGSMLYTRFFVTYAEPNGDKIWENFYAKVYEGGAGVAMSLLELPNGEIVAAGVVGRAPDDGGEGRLYITRLDTEGNELGYKLLAPFGTAYGCSIINTNDGGLLFVASRRYQNLNSQVYVVKMDISLNKIWEKSYGGVGDESAWGVVELYQGGYAITGFSDSETEKGDVYLLILDPNGNLVTEKTIQDFDTNPISGEDYYEVGNAIIQTIDGGLAITGRRAFVENSDGGNLFLLKTDAMGNIQN